MHAMDNWHDWRLPGKDRITGRHLILNICNDGHVLTGRGVKLVLCGSFTNSVKSNKAIKGWGDPMSTDWNPDRTERLRKRRLEKRKTCLESSLDAIAFCERNLHECPEPAETPDGFRRDLSVFNGYYIFQSVGMKIPKKYYEKMEKKRPNDPY